MVSTPNLYELARGLELRWRIRVFLGHLITVLVVSTALSLLTAIVHVVSWMVIPTGRVILMANGAAVVVALVLTALRRRSPQLLLADADRTYETRELLSSAIEFAQTEPSNASDAERAFRDLVAKQGDDLSTMVDPATVYPIRMPRLTSVVGALAVALGVLLLLNASGWFAGSPVELAQEGLLLEETGRRLADRGASEELQELADEIRRLGERLRSGEMDPEEARRRIDQLGEHVEEQMRNLERLGEFDTNQEMDLPPETEDAVRSALRSSTTRISMFS